MTSPPVWADIIASFCNIWTQTMFVVLLPTYFNEVFAIRVDYGSSLSMLPHVATSITLPLGGRLADLMLEKNLLSVTNVRKLFTCGGFGGQVVMLLVLILSKEQIVATIALTVASGSGMLAESGYLVNKLSMAPIYAPILEGVTNGIGNIAGKGSHTTTLAVALNMVILPQ